MSFRIPLARGHVRKVKGRQTRTEANYELTILQPPDSRSHLEHETVSERTGLPLVTWITETGRTATPLLAGDVMVKSWKCDDLIRVRADGGGWRVWRVIGVFLGATNQEDVIELETLDRDRNTQGRMCVPRELLNASIGAESC